MRWWWTVPWCTLVGKGDHNQNDRSYTIHITKTGKLITRKCKHVKLTQITAEQYLQDQLDKHIVQDPLEDILKQIEKWTPVNHTHTHKEQFKNTQNGSHTSDTQQACMPANPGDNIIQTNRRVKYGQKESLNSMPLIEMFRSLVSKVMITPEPETEE